VLSNQLNDSNMQNKYNPLSESLEMSIIQA
jgi:hypothetical protein